MAAWLKPVRRIMELHSRPIPFMLTNPMTVHLDTQADLDDAVHALVRIDPRLGPVLETAGMPSLRRREPGFAGLAAIVCGQQLSTKAAAAIWGRVSTTFDPFHHDAVKKARADRLGRLGLSAAKIKSLKFIARELSEERLNLDVLAEEDADAAHATLTRLHGIGPWTADIYLLFCLGHGDAWPAGDLAIQEAMRIGLGLKLRPTVKEMQPLAEAWRPLRGAAAHLWWSYYHAIKKREGVIAGAATASPKPPAKKKVAKKKSAQPKSVSNSKGVLNKSRVAKSSAKTAKTALPKTAAKKAGARK
ncbi:putative 3-methyladenine DNA glycosylase/8-oxoguanine DNA glycosylase [Bradyrhizobiaceae bacterium SG-6C]|nr:putative 3-methyladenine DNA glycosylase/8-oxoguanine DNA glycosylase [Bradyrhizobiaceae bacterium SG-6C]